MAESHIKLMVSNIGLDLKVLKPLIEAVDELVKPLVEAGMVEDRSGQLSTVVFDKRVATAEKKLNEVFLDLNKLNKELKSSPSKKAGKWEDKARKYLLGEEKRIKEVKDEINLLSGA